MGVTCGWCLLDLCEPPFLLFCVPMCRYVCETALPDSLWSQQWLEPQEASCKGKMPAVGSLCQSLRAESPLRTGTQDSHTGGGSTVSPPSSLGLLGAFSCVGDLRTNEGQARHVGLTAGEGVALSNVVQSRPAPGTAGLRGPDLQPTPEATGLAPPCSLGRSENL